MFRKITVFLCLICITLSVNAETLQNVGISKYAVLEVTKDNTPLREKDNEDAKRISHLFSNTVLFADKQTDNYYRVELKEGEYSFINKKFVEVQAIIPEKRFEAISKITFKEDKKRYNLKIETPMLTAFKAVEAGNNINFSIYDNRYDPFMVRTVNQSGRFYIPPKYDDSLNVFYTNDYPLFGYDVLPYDKGYIISVKKAPRINKRKPLKGIKVVIDAGHGGCEKGACAFNLEEKDINLQIARILKRELRKRGAKVYMTRKKDKQVGLYERVDFAREKQADILLSIHQNSLPNPKDIDKKYGVGTYYYYEQSKPLAQSILDNLTIATGFRDDGVNNRSFVLTRSTSQLSVLIECGYLIREQEAMKLKQRHFQKIVAKAITKGCEDYLRKAYRI